MLGQPELSGSHTESMGPSTNLDDLGGTKPAKPGTDAVLAFLKKLPSLLVERDTPADRFRLSVVSLPNINADQRVLLLKRANLAIEV